MTGSSEFTGVARKGHKSMAKGQIFIDDRVMSRWAQQNLPETTNASSSVLCNITSVGTHFLL